MSKKILTVGGFVLAGAAVAGVTAVAITQSGLLNPKTTPVVNSGATANPGQGFIPFVPAESPISKETVSYTHLTLPTSSERCRSRWSPYH